jgi:hypothetical protein
LIDPTARELIESPLEVEHVLRVDPYEPAEPE